MSDPRQSNKELKKVYNTFYGWFVEYLDRIDPLGLLGDGNPGKEYALEASLITPLISRATSSGELAAQMQGVFAECFTAEMAGEISFTPIAEDCMRKWRALTVPE